MIELLELHFNSHALKFKPSSFIWLYELFVSSFRKVKSHVSFKRVYSYCQGYQFWTRADDGGYFTINHVLTGDYNLYAWVPGFIGDYRCDALVNVSQGTVPSSLYCILNWLKPSIFKCTVTEFQVEM